MIVKEKKTSQPVYNYQLFITLIVSIAKTLDISFLINTLTLKVIKQIASCCWFSNLNFFKKRSLFSSVNHFIFKSDDDSRDLCHLFGKTADGRNGSDQSHRRTWRVSAPPRTVGFGRPRRGLVPGHDRTSTDECKEARNLKKLQKKHI